MSFNMEACMLSVISFFVDIYCIKLGFRLSKPQRWRSQFEELLRRLVFLRAGSKGEDQGSYIHASLPHLASKLDSPAASPKGLRLLYRNDVEHI